MIFGRVICGVDGSDEGIEAARQAAGLVEPDGRLLLIAVAEVDVVVHAGFAASLVLDELRREGKEALEVAHSTIAGAHLAATRLLEGPVSAAILEEARHERATLLCVGTHGRRRASGMLLGGAVTTLVHEAHLPVCVARKHVNGGAFPSSIAVGVDGSPESGTAVGLASVLAQRFGASVRLVVATAGKTIDVEAVQGEHPGAEPVARRPVDALVSASADADLLIVGSKGLHGVKALGSVSERVAHQAQCSVLIVRGV
jgi:nucleotide-binding universal stress UspA family protein